MGSCGGQIILRTSSDVFIFNLGLCFEGLFWERCILKGWIACEGHCRLQSWTLIPTGSKLVAKLCMWGTNFSHHSPQSHFIHEPRAVTNVQDWSPHMSFVLKGSQFSVVKCWFKSKTSIQEYRNEIQNSYINLCMNYAVHVSNTMWSIKNQPSNSPSCSDIALRLLVLVVGNLYWGLQSDVFVFNNWGCVLKGCVWERCILKG